MHLNRVLCLSGEAQTQAPFLRRAENTSRVQMLTDEFIAEDTSSLGREKPQRLMVIRAPLM